MQTTKVVVALTLQAVIFFAHAQTEIPNTTQPPAAAQITGPFGSVVDVPQPSVPKPAQRGISSAKQDDARIPITDATFADAPGFREARQAREARAALPDTTFLDGLKAAIQISAPYRLLLQLRRPVFHEEQPANTFDFLEQVPEPLTIEERDFIVQNGTGSQSLEWAYEKVKGIRSAKLVASQHEVASFIVLASPAILLVVLGIAGWLWRSRQYDKQTTHAFDSWHAKYEKASSPGQASRMAVAFLSQSIHLALSAGAINRKQRDAVTATLKQMRATTAMTMWLGSSLPNVLRVIPPEEVSNTPARAVGMLMLLAWMSPKGEEENSVRAFLFRR